MRGSRKEQPVTVRPVPNPRAGWTTRATLVRAETAGWFLLFGDGTKTETFYSMTALATFAAEQKILIEKAGQATR